MKARPTLLALAASLVLGGCALADDQVFDRYAAFLAGGQITEALRGDRNGFGNSDFRLTLGSRKLCYLVETDDIAEPTAIHIHRGAYGTTGPIVLTLKPRHDGESRGCASMPQDMIAEFKVQPADFYVDIHNVEYPEGALRGQLEQIQSAGRFGIDRGTGNK
jgi:hypothetical protein